jgi:hypothetical protein
MYTAIISTITQRHFTMQYENENEMLQAINSDFVRANTDYNQGIYYMIPRKSITMIKIETDE